MLTINDQHIAAVWLPIDGREYTRYFSDFPITQLDQQVVIYHKKAIRLKNWKDVGAWVDVFICREKITLDDLQDVAKLCVEHWQLMIRDEVIYGIQLHVPLTSAFLGKEDYFTELVNALWTKRYIIAQTIMHAKEYPFVQRSITDPALLDILVPHMKQIENQSWTDIVPNILAVQRRAEVIAQLFSRLEQEGYDASLLDAYDISLMRCDG